MLSELMARGIDYKLIRRKNSVAEGGVLCYVATMFSFLGTKTKISYSMLLYLIPVLNYHVFYLPKITLFSIEVQAADGFDSTTRHSVVRSKHRPHLHKVIPK